MRKEFCVVILLTFSSQVFAKQTKTNVWVESELSSHICWYQNKRYSEGAIIDVAEFKLICEKEKTSQKNSKLKWLKINKEGQIVYPKELKRITIN